MSNVLSAKSRTAGQRSQLTEIRNQGEIPGVVYGYKVENTPISVKQADFTKTMREVGRNGVISLELEGKTVNVVLQEYQEDPIKGEVIHIDFLSVNMDEAIEANVRVELVNDAAGVSEGGLVQQLLHEIVVTAKPDEIPDAIEVDIASLQIGDTVTIGEIRKNYTIEINHDDDDAIVTVTPPTVEEETEEDQVEQEPEVISEAEEE